MTLTWIAFLAYALAAIALGWRARLRATEGEEFWTAGRSLGGAAVGLSISAGFLSVSWSCVYAVQLFYGYGLGALWLVTIPWLIALGGIYLLARRYNALAEFSQPEMVARRFGAAAGRWVAVALIFVFLVWGGAEIYVAANLLAPGLGLGVPGTILLISLVVAIYAALGGFGAVVSTDKLQYAVVVLYILAMGWLALRGMGELAAAQGEGGGLAAGWRALLGGDWQGAKSGRSWTAVLAPGIATIVLTFAAYLPGWLFETDLWLRVQAARDGRAARRGVALAAVNGALFVGLLPLLIGVAGLALFPMQGGQFPPEIGVEGDALFTALVERYAPSWLALLVAVGLVAAAMSTIDTCVNVVALSLSYDLLGQRRGGESRRGSMAATLIAVAAAAIFALNTESLWDIFYLSSGVLTTAVAFPVAAIFLPAVRPRAVWLSSLVGMAATVAAYFLESRGHLSGIQPAWLAESGVGFILWGLLAAGLAALVGQWTERGSYLPESPPGGG